MQLGVNIDHVATIREARKINEPSPLEAAFAAKSGGADQITLHLREDRRHIHDEDAQMIINASFLPTNLECSINEEIITKVCDLGPHRATLVPERREEVTTEGGLDLLGNMDSIKMAIERLKARDIAISLFIDPDSQMIKAAGELGVDMVELHTGSYANLHLMLHTNLQKSKNALPSRPRLQLERALADSLAQIERCAQEADRLGLQVAAGHGLNYINVKKIAAIPQLCELNIGHSIIARSVFTGLERAVTQMRALLLER